MDDSKAFDPLMELANTKGVSDVRLISPDMIPVDDTLAAFCKKPGCSGYGQSMSCPPHAKGPGWFREQIKTFSHALIFKFDVPTAALLGNERLDLLGLIHDTAAQLEEKARAMGFHRAKGFAGGSCKEIFCSDHLNCKVLHDKGKCRNPGRARQSMSSVGVNFLKLSKIVGWKMRVITAGTDPEKIPMGMVAGMVLLD